MNAEAVRLAFLDVLAVLLSSYILTVMNIFEKCALKTPTILLPNKELDLTAWAVIACDQYTQDTAYWNKVAAITKGHYSTLNMILPEVYLPALTPEQRKEAVEHIKTVMKDYLANGAFAAPVHAMLYIERKTAYNRMRRGIVTAIDLEKYDWSSVSKAEIRATEETIVDRLPPRMEIRRGAAVEMPHIMLLVNDPSRLLIEEVGAAIHESGNVPLYAADLMMDAGSIAGWAISESCSAAMETALETLYRANTGADGSVFMFSVGDGNHSLATAKAIWEEYKLQCGGIKQSNGAVSMPEPIKDNPLRYALVEIVNLYDEGLTFEPIHRVIFGAAGIQLIDFLQSKLGGDVVRCSTKDELLHNVETIGGTFGFSSQAGGFCCLNTNLTQLAVSALQPLLDEFIQMHDLEIDYIHGAEDTLRIAEQADTVSILLPPIDKESFFSTIAVHGSLPRKSFSMGEASEKRFYLECRSLIS